MRSMKKLVPINIKESFELLKQYSIPVAPYHLIKPNEDIENYKHALKYPLVVKAISNRIIHKTEAGAVKIGIRNFDELIEAVKELNSKFEGFIDFILIQKMISGIELSIGGLRDSVFGPVVMFGSGGILIELFEDVSFRLVPVTLSNALEMVNETKASKLLEGFRGGPYIDKTRVARLIMNVSKLIWNNKNISELDINPIIVNDKFEYAVDVRIFKKEEDLHEQRSN